MSLTCDTGTLINKQTDGSSNFADLDKKFVYKSTNKVSSTSNSMDIDTNINDQVSNFRVIKESIILFLTNNQFNKETILWWILSTLGIFCLCHFVVDLAPSTFQMALFATITWGFAYIFALVVATTANNNEKMDQKLENIVDQAQINQLKNDAFLVPESLQ